MTAEIICWPRHLLYHCKNDCERCAIDACPHQVLSSCVTCGAAEAEMATECPGYRLHHDERMAVSNGKLDFVRGRWVTLYVSEPIAP